MKKLSLLAFSVLASAFINFSAFGDTDFHFLDVGQGSSVLIESQGHYLLYDGGNKDKSSFVVSYLKEHGVSSLDYVIASHYDADHLNGVVGALNAFPSKKVYAPDYTTDTKIYDSFLATLSSKKLKKEQPSVGTTFPLGDATVTVVGPVNTDYSDVNNCSISLHIQDSNKSVLLTGDAEAEAEADMIKTGLSLDSDVYMAGHHGSASSSSWDLLQAVTPEYAVISCGTDNSYGHPTADTLEKFKTMGTKIFRTDKQGTLRLNINKNKLTWNTTPTSDYTPGDAGDVPAQPQGKADFSQKQEATSTVYWTPGGKSYHNTRSCVSLKRSKKINSGNLSDALAAGKTDPCNFCFK